MYDLLASFRTVSEQAMAIGVERTTSQDADVDMMD